MGLRRRSSWWTAHGTLARRAFRRIFDLALALERRPDLDVEKTVTCFLEYMRRSGAQVSRAEFEANFRSKMDDPAFLADIAPLLSPNAGSQFDAKRAAEHILDQFIARLPGEPWKGATGHRSP